MLYVTGATGHSGKWFLKRLQQEGYAGKIRCVMRESQADCPEKYEIFKTLGLNVEFAVGNLDDAVFLDESLKGISTILHIAGIQKSAKLMDAAIKNNVRWAILVHTTGRFSKFKSASEEYIRIEDQILKLREQLAVTVLRPTMIYGSSGDRNMYRLINFLNKYPLFPVFGDGSNLMQPVTAKDLGQAYYDVLIRPEVTKNKEYDLSGKAPIAYLDMIKCIKKYLNSKVKLVHIPMNLSVFAAKLYNGIFGKHAIITVEQVLRMQESKAFSHNAATKDFGYNPLPFEAGVKVEVEEYLSGVRVDFSHIKYQ